MHELQLIETRDDLFLALGVDKQIATYLLYVKGIENCYTTFEIKKKNGNTRTIDAPEDKLKYIQKRLVELLWANQVKVWKKQPISFEHNIAQKKLEYSEKYRVPNMSHGFEVNKSIITNAQIHRNKKYVLNIDLKDFFPSLHFGRVRGFFQKDNDFKVSKEVATLIAQLTCYKGTLPQGAPSSPLISNLICKIMDFRILKISKKYKLDYTRYVDDLTFSTNNATFISKYEEFVNILNIEIVKAGFEINQKKTRLQIEDSRQVVTGLIVNKKINVPKEYHRNTRAMAYSLYRTGEFEINGQKGTVPQLNGRFAYINQLDKYNNQLNKNKSLVQNNIIYQKNLNSRDMVNFKKFDTRKKNFNKREKEYQKFLFYKNFYGNEYLTIVTEGKTDIRYIKAALRKNYSRYPNLVERKIGVKNGKFVEIFTYKINFFKRSKTIRYYFDLPLHGADPIQNLYNFFRDSRNDVYSNYLSYFNQKDNEGKHKFIGTSKPTILLFDNELETTKPLKKFINGTKKNSEIDKLKKELKLELQPNVFVMTHPLIGENKECELEDLFSEKVLSTRINGKTFSRDGGSDFYGKDIFSKYVLANYKSIDFSNFIPLLDMIDKLNM